MNRCIPPDLSGQRFGKLIAVDFHKGKGWRCTCDCGGERFLRSSFLTAGNNMSCGCMARHHRKREKHGMAGTPEYMIWATIRNRCTNPKYKDYPRYGGRGITMCDEWKNSFESFLAHIGLRPSPELSVDRLDNSKGYEPGNVAWRTSLDQNRNKRSNFIVEIDGVKMPLSEAVEKHGNGIKYFTVTSRIQRGWSPEQAIRKPAMAHRYDA